MSLVLLAYVSVAFVAGIVALAMPCCFSVLLPSYFAQSFKTKTRLIGMTIIFSAGIATIMLPIAIGAIALANTISTNHNLVFVAGGFLMIIIGLWTLWGRGMLPQFNLPVNLKRTDVPSVYTLGLFSGAATTCCAPVLAGVVLLTALSTSFLEGMLVGFTYVLGMTTPLLFIALVWDKYAASGENPLRGRMVNFRLLGQEISMHSSKLVAGTMFVIMGAVTVGLGLTGTMLPTPGTQVIAVFQAQLQDSAVRFFSSLGYLEFVVISLGILGVGGGTFLVRNRLRNPRHSA